MDIITQACDVCKVQKKQANRWWKVYRVKGGAAIYEWDSAPKRGKPAAHLCGENHLFEWITKHVTGVTP